MISHSIQSYMKYLLYIYIHIYIYIYICVIINYTINIIDVTYVYTLLYHLYIYIYIYRGCSVFFFYYNYICKFNDIFHEVFLIYFFTYIKTISYYQVEIVLIYCEINDYSHTMEHLLLYNYMLCI